MKKIPKLDPIFILILWIFGVIWAYEVIDILRPYYSFPLAAWFLLLVSFWYYIFKKWWLWFLFSWESLLELRKIVFEKIPRFRENIDFLKDNLEVIVSSVFSIVAIIIVSSMFFNTWVLLPYLVVIFYGVYFIAKLYWYKLKFSIPKSSISSANNLRFLLIFLWIYIVILAFIFNSFNTPASVRPMWYIVFWLIYILTMWGLFLSWDIKIRGLFSVYNLLSFFIIFGLVWFLAFQNGFFTSEEVLEETPIIERETALGEPVIAEPLLISDEIEIISETKLVSEIYDISPWIQLWSSGESVTALQEVLQNLDFFKGDISWKFDENTRLALVSALKEKCFWPETTKGILGPLAKQCIDSLEITIDTERKIDPEERYTRLVSDEVNISQEEENISISWTNEWAYEANKSLEESSTEIENELVESENEIVTEISEGANGSVQVLEDASDWKENAGGAWVEEVSYSIKQVSEVYALAPGMQLWSSWESVKDLQRVLWSLQYYLWEVNGEFDTETQEALIDTLRSSCWWPESTKWVFWPLAKTCIDGLTITVSQ